jgi:putative chitinase
MPMKMLREGTRGLHVRRWQSFLIDRGFLAGRADGDFGPLTRTATAAYQRANGLAADGIVGPRTAAAADWLVDKPPIEDVTPWLTDVPEPGPPETEPAPETPTATCEGSTRLTDSMLRQIMPRIRPSSCAVYAPFLQQAMEEFSIATPPRAAAFLAQLAHESGQLRYMEEIWGPTAAQRRYEPVSQLAARLGNTEPGDGRRFKGRGPIQLTGRANYRRYGRALGVDLIAQPELAATPQVGFRVAGLFWRQNGLNELADAQRFKAITRRINGGFNGLADRINFYERAKGLFQVPSIRVLEPREPAAPVPFPRGLDAPGEITPTAAERSPRRVTRRVGKRAPATRRKKTAKPRKPTSRSVARHAGARTAAKRARTARARKKRR